MNQVAASFGDVRRARVALRKEIKRSEERLERKISEAVDSMRWALGIASGVGTAIIAGVQIVINIRNDMQEKSFVGHKELNQ